MVYSVIHFLEIKKNPKIYEYIFIQHRKRMGGYVHIKYLLCGWLPGEIATGKGGGRI